MITPLEIKRQTGMTSDFCTGCVIASIAEPCVGEPCDEAYSYAMAKRISGDPISKFGINPISTLLGAIKYGVLPKSKSPYRAGTYNRDFLADWKNWESSEDFVAKPFKAYKRVYDIKSALKESTLMARMYWQEAWDHSPYVESVGEYNRLSPHEVRILGFEKGYYVIQNSRGTSLGDKGIWYIAEDIPFTHVYQPLQEASLLYTLTNLFS